MDEDKLRVLFVTKSDLSGTAGHNIATREVAMAFKRSTRVDVTFVCPTPREELSEDAEETLSPRIQFSEHRVDLPILEYASEAIDVFFRLRRAILQVDPDLIIARMAPVFVAPPLLASYYDIPYVLLSRGTAYKSLRFHTVLRQMYKYNVRVAEKVYVASNEIKDDTDQLRKRGQSPATFLPNAVNPERFYSIERNTARSEIEPELGDSFVVGFVGSMKSYHRLDLLIKALNHVSVTQEIRLLLVGNGPELERYRQLAKQEGFAGNILFPGFVPHAEVSTYMSACDILYGVSDQDSATPVKVYEYLACERPVIVRNIDEMAFIRDRNVGRVVERTPQSIGTAIEDLYETSSRDRAEMGRRGREYILQNRTWDAAVGTILDDIGDLE